MLDPENEVYTKVKTAILAKYPNVNMASTYVRSPSSFPHVSLEMSDCQTLRLLQSQDTSAEEFARVVFDVNVYSNDVDQKKSICKGIVKVLDDVFIGMNFARIYCKPVPNLEDASIYRIAARYRAATDGKYFYRR